MLIDVKASEMTMLTIDIKNKKSGLLTKLPMPLLNKTNGNKKPPVITKTGIYKTILGFKCEKTLVNIGDSVNISAEWLPFISFLVVFIGVVLLIRLGAKAIESAVEVVMLGWLNRIGGILLYVAMYTLVYSVLLFYAAKMDLLRPETIEKSIVYSWIEPLGPKVIGLIGQVLPWFKDLFGDLTAFFDKVSQQVPPR